MKYQMHLREHVRPKAARRNALGGALWQSTLELFMSDTQTGRRDTLEEPRPLSNLCMRVIWHLPNKKYYGENSEPERGGGQGR